jgi:DNA (cytosine-5)-methyltransferase 1
VFVVADLGGERASEILALAEGLSGHPAPSRKAGQKPAGTLASRTKGGVGLGTDTELDGGLVAPTVTSKWAKGSGGPAGNECQNLIAHTLRAEGHDASEDGTGRGVPLTCFHPIGSDPLHSSDDTTHCMGAQASVAVAFNLRGRDGGAMPEPTDLASVRSASGGSSRSYVAPQAGVRRLTPTECERLMGWPDGWTAHKAVLVKDGNRWIPTGKTVAQADGPRYKQCGNGVVSSVAEWIARRIGSNDPCASPQNRKLDTCARGAAE